MFEMVSKTIVVMVAMLPKLRCDFHLYNENPVRESKPGLDFEE
jgi:hypothetical protein